MKTPIFTGSGLAMITPMNADGSVNYAEIDRILEDQLASHTDAILSCGTTGEASTLEDEEHLQVIKHVVKRVNGRVPVIAGTGSNNTAHAVMMSKGQPIWVPMPCWWLPLLQQDQPGRFDCQLHRRGRCHGTARDHV